MCHGKLQRTFKTECLTKTYDLLSRKAAYAGAGLAQESSTLQMMLEKAVQVALLAEVRDVRWTAWTPGSKQGCLGAGLCCGSRSLLQGVTRWQLRSAFADCRATKNSRPPVQEGSLCRGWASQRKSSNLRQCFRLRSTKRPASTVTLSQQVSA